MPSPAPIQQSLFTATALTSAPIVEAAPIVEVEAGETAHPSRSISR